MGWKILSGCNELFNFTQRVQDNWANRRIWNSS